MLLYTIFIVYVSVLKPDFSFQPEWYFGQVLNWIRDHSSFLDNRIQNLLEIAGFYSVDAKVDLFGLEGVIFPS